MSAMGDFFTGDFNPDPTGPGSSAVTGGDINNLLNTFAGILAADAAALGTVAAWAMVIPGGVAIGLPIAAAAGAAGILSGVFWALSAADQWVLVEPAGGASIEGPASNVAELRLNARDDLGIRGSFNGVPARVRVFRINRQAITDSRIFNKDFYVGIYEDLHNPGTATDHWVKFGIREGRRGSAVLDPPFYHNSNSDLVRAFGASNFYRSIQHYNEFGISEGRRGSFEFDVNWYLNNHGDLVAAFGANNFPAAYKHWFQFGLSEGRRSSADFDIGFYLRSNQDLQGAFGPSNFPRALQHWLEFGRAEGRVPVG
jgi:hypothetical protein